MRLYEGLSMLARVYFGTATVFGLNLTYGSHQYCRLPLISIGAPMIRSYKNDVYGTQRVRVRVPGI